MLPTIFTEKAPKTIVSCEASSKFHSTSSQNERFARCFRPFSQKKLPKRSFRARLPRNFKEQASKKIVSCEASSKFHSTSSQNERFARCFRPFSQKKLPKRSFRARLPRNFKEQASKKIVSCEASSKFHSTSSQNERFARCLRQFSQKKLPKWLFRTRLPPNLTEQASKTSFSCEASSKFHRTILPKRTFRAMLPTISTENLHFATVSCNRPAESYERVHPAKAKCASRYSGVPSKISKCTFYYSGVRKNVWIQRRKSGATRGIQKSPFYHSFGHLTSTKWREGCAGELKICIASPQFWTSDEHKTTRGLREDPGRFAFHLSFGRPTSTKWREGCDDDVQTSHFTSVLDVRRPRSDERVARRSQKFAFHHSFGRPTSTKWREGGLPSWSTKPTLRKKKKEILKKSWSTTILSRSSQQIFSADLLSRSSQQIFSADLLSRFCQQIFSADLLSRFSQQIFSADPQQIFSADLLSRSSQQIFSADLLSRFSQQIFSADFLSRSSHSRSSHSRSSQQIFFSRSSQQIFSADLLIRSSQQFFSADLLSRSSQQIFSADLLSYHVASYYLIMLVVNTARVL